VSKTRVYLAGPLSGCNETQKTKWRRAFKKECERHGCDFDLATPESWPADWDFTRDMEAIDDCDILVANMWKESIGTTLEIMHARSRGKPVVLIDPNHLESKILGGLIAPERPVESIGAAVEATAAANKTLGKFFIEKRDQVLEDFDRNKLMRSIKLACAEARINDFEFPNQIIGPVVDALRKASDKRVVTTADIRTTVFRELDRLAAELEKRSTKANIALQVKEAWLRRETYKQGDKALDEALLQRLEAEGRIGKLEAEKDDLLATLKAQEAELTQLRRGREAKSEDAPTDLTDALRRLDSDFKHCLEVHERAFESAKQAPYTEVTKASEALQLLGRYAAERHVARLLSEDFLGASEWFKQRVAEVPGLEYAAKDSKDHQDQTRVIHAGVKLLADQHLCLGDSWHPERCLRIHFATSGDRVVIVWCGRHL
jgi:nucleoside 2-deoxyribosyltransferase